MRVGVPSSLSGRPCRDVFTALALATESDEKNIVLVFVRNVNRCSLKGWVRKLAVAAVFGLRLATIYHPFMHTRLKTQLLTTTELGICAALASVVFSAT